jgi:hypothetical protein
MQTNSVSIEGRFPDINGRAQNSTNTCAPARAPITTQGPPLSLNSATVLNMSPLQIQKPAQEYSPSAQHLSELLRFFSWLDLKRINRPPQKNYAQLLVDDGLLRKSVSEYIRPLKPHENVFAQTFHHGTSNINEEMIREFGLGGSTTFYLSAQEARSYGTCVIAGQLEPTVRIGVIENTMQEWDILIGYFDDIVDCFARAKGLSSMQKLFLQKHLISEVLKAQGLEAFLLRNGGNSSWRSLILLNPEKIVLEFV